MTPKIKLFWQAVGAIAASGILVTVLLYATNAYIKSAVAAEMLQHPTVTGFAEMRSNVDTVQEDMVLVKDGVADNAATLTTVAASQQRFEELFIEYLGRQ